MKIFLQAISEESHQMDRTDGHPDTRTDTQNLFQSPPPSEGDNWRGHNFKKCVFTIKMGSTGVTMTIKVCEVCEF